MSLGPVEDQGKLIIFLLILGLLFVPYEKIILWVKHVLSTNLIFIGGRIGNGRKR